MTDSFPCPKCSRLLRRSGEVAVEDAVFPVFQCDECVVPVQMFGEPFDAAFTFAVDADGKPFDPADEDALLPL